MCTSLDSLNDHGDKVPVVLSPGLAVVPDELLRHMTREQVAEMNGGNTVVLSASEALDGDDAPPVTHRSCKVCGLPDDQKPMVYRGEDWCCEQHRKVLTGEVPREAP